MTVKGHTDDTDGTDFLWLAALGRRTLATNGTQEMKEIKEIWAAHDNLNDILRRRHFCYFFYFCGTLKKICAICGIRVTLDQDRRHLTFPFGPSS